MKKHSSSLSVADPESIYSIRRERASYRGDPKLLKTCQKSMNTAGQRLLFVANKKLPPGDYRVRYAMQPNDRLVVLGMPDRTETLPCVNFQKMDFREGLALRDIRSFWRLFVYLRRNRQNVALVHFFSTKLILMGPICAFLAGVPSVVTVTGLGRVFNENRVIYQILRHLYKYLMRISVACASEVLFQNRGDMDLLRAWFRNRGNQFRYIGSAVAIDEHAPKNYNTSPLLVLMVARILPSKGIADFLVIAKQLTGQGMRFVLVGPPSVGYEELHQSVIEHTSLGIIDYRGELHGEELRDLYQASHIFLFTSHGEGLPRVMLEAGSAGLCPVAYDINANLDLVKFGGGFLVPLKDSNAAVEILRRLSDDRELLQQNSQVFEALVRANFSIGAYQRRMNAVVESTLKDGVGFSHDAKRRPC